MAQAPPTPTPPPTRPTAPAAADDDAGRPRGRRPRRGARTRLVRVQDHLRAIRTRIEDRPVLRRVWQLCVTVVGFAVLGLGVLAIPYPGPGWLIVFAGPAVLAGEFARARHLLRCARLHHDGWTAWVRRQDRLVTFAVLAATAVVLGTTLWLMGGLWLVAGQVGQADRTWLRSPLLG